MTSCGANSTARGRRARGACLRMLTGRGSSRQQGRCSQGLGVPLGPSASASSCAPEGLSAASPHPLEPIAHATLPWSVPAARAQRCSPSSLQGWVPIAAVLRPVPPAALPPPPPASCTTRARFPLATSSGSSAQPPPGTSLISATTSPSQARLHTGHASLHCCACAPALLGSQARAAEGSSKPGAAAAVAAAAGVAAGAAAEVGASASEASSGAAFRHVVPASAPGASSGAAFRHVVPASAPGASSGAAFRHVVPASAPGASSGAAFRHVVPASAPGATAAVSGARSGVVGGGGQLRA